MSAKNALEKYTRAVENLQEHMQDNAGIFEAHKELLGLVMDAENELRDAVAEEKEPLENHKFKILIYPQTQTVYDEEKIKMYIAKDKLGEVIKVVERPLRVSIKEINLQ